jgi:two-component system, chemotaxis family, sensor kinase Cph1
LRTIQVFASLILEGDDPLPDHVINRVSRMNAAAKRMQLLIYDILSYSRVSKVNEAMAQVDLNAILEKTLEEVSEEIEERSAEIERDNLPTIKGIPFLLNQLFLNIVRNALKFHRPDTKSVIIIRVTETRINLPDALEPGKAYYRISISDNGIGFSNEFRESIFDVFTRLNNNEKYNGSGIGLALCKKIMQNHSGTITADGEEGKGAEFALYFPIA